MAGHVYLIGSRKFNWYKIGKSSRASVRVTELGILLPFRIEVIAVWKADNHHYLERLLHEQYGQHHINGEWFSFTKEQLALVVAAMSYASTEIAAKFANIDKDVLIQEPYTGKVGRRIDALIKENAELRARLESRPTVGPPRISDGAGAQRRIGALIKKISSLEEQLKLYQAKELIQ